REREADRARLARQDDVLLLEPLDHLALAPRARRHRVLGAEAPDEARELGDLLVELLVRRLGALAPGLALLEVAGERGRKLGHLAASELAHPGGAFVEEP